MIKENELSLLPLSAEDKEFYYQVYSNKYLMKFVTTPLTHRESDKSFDLTIKKMSQPHPVILLFTIKHTYSNKKIGFTGLRWNQSSSDAVEIGIILLKAFHGKELAHKAKTRLIHYAFKSLNVNKIIANCEKNNMAANKANQKLGFFQVGEYVDEERKVIKIKWELNNEKEGQFG